MFREVWLCNNSSQWSDVTPSVKEVTALQNSSTETTTEECVSAIIGESKSNTSVCASATCSTSACVSGTPSPVVCESIPLVQIQAGL